MLWKKAIWRYDDMNDLVLYCSLASISANDEQDYQHVKTQFVMIIFSDFAYFWTSHTAYPSSYDTDVLQLWGIRLMTWKFTSHPDN